MNDAKSIEATKIIEHLEKEPKFDVLKTREGYFRKYDHQLMHEMYAVEALKANELEEPVGHLQAERAGARRQRAARDHRRHGRGERLQDGRVRAARSRSDARVADNLGRSGASLLPKHCARSRRSIAP